MSMSLGCNTDVLVEQDWESADGRSLQVLLLFTSSSHFLQLNLMKLYWNYGNRRQLSYDVLPYLDLFSTKQHGQIYQYILVLYFCLKKHNTQIQKQTLTREESVMIQLATQDCIELSKKAGIKPLDPPGWMFGQVVVFFCFVHLCYYCYPVRT